MRMCTSTFNNKNNVLIHVGAMFAREPEDTNTTSVCTMCKLTRCTANSSGRSAQNCSKEKTFVKSTSKTQHLNEEEEVHHAKLEAQGFHWTKIWAVELFQQYLPM